MSTNCGADWGGATERARNQAAEGATFHCTILPNVWWVDPVPKDPPPNKPATYWVTLHPDGCYSCVCTTFLPDKGPTSACSHIARVCLETRATPMIYTENRACPGGHDTVIKGYTKEALHHPQCGCSE
jgi:hypothetical protein